MAVLGLTTAVLVLYQGYSSAVPVTLVIYEFDVDFTTVLYESTEGTLNYLSHLSFV